MKKMYAFVCFVHVIISMIAASYVSTYQLVIICFQGTMEICGPRQVSRTKEQKFYNTF